MILVLINTACKKDKIICTDEESFCAFVDDQNFDATGTLINDFLTGLKKNENDENLEKLRNWFECKSCVKKAEIICNSCIETLPEQSELSIDFISNGQDINKTLDISMDEPLKFHRYHD
ncbi:MAG: hypothetical protein COC01_07965 [Bacteroidetes bacterium]|nr:MAG: hypothetical protein COC01_07965 [Bacteroidota bacterium]